MKMDSDYQPRPIMEVLDEVHARVIKQRGSLYTEEEVLQMVDEVRAEIRKRDAERAKLRKEEDQKKNES